VKKGIVYTLIDWFIEILKYFNLVEYFKLLSKRIYAKDKILASRFAVDLFIILKWVLVALLWQFNVNKGFFTWLVWYLIVTNIYTYFYYHVWTKDLAKPFYDLDRLKRRFLNLILSIGFNILAFAYLFAQPYFENFKWAKGYSTLKDSLLFSTSNSLSTSCDSVESITELGSSLSLIETLISFVFLTIILSNSIPQTKTD
jgi:hypothetical protein